MKERLFAISDHDVAGEPSMLRRFAELARHARPGSVVFQLRDLDRSARERLELGRAVAALARENGQRFVVNDRIDLALLLGADGVHLGEAAVETRDARRLLGPGAFVSRACHDPEAVARFEADALLLSPLLAPRKGRPALGLEALTRARNLLRGRTNAPRLVALGGVTSDNAGACLAAGADAVAAIGGVLAGDVEPLALVRALGIER